MEPAELKELQGRINRVLTRRLFFVAGAPKSGTTWLQRMLDAHPQIVCSGEGHFADTLGTLLTSAFKEYNSRQKLVSERVYEHKPYYSALQRQHFDFVVASLACLLMGERPMDDEVKCVGDKTPRNTFYLGYLSELFPDAKMIHIIRDGRDVVVSLSHHAYRAGQANALAPGSPRLLENIRNFSRAWAENISAARQFGETEPARYREVRYEDLQSEPEPSLRGLLELLEVDAGDDMVRQCIESSDFRRWSKGREKGEEDKRSFFRKGVVGDWKDFFDESALTAFDNAASTLLQELGYAEHT